MIKHTVTGAVSALALLAAASCMATVEPTALEQAEANTPSLQDEASAMLAELVVNPASAEVFESRCENAMLLAGKFITDLETRDTPPGVQDIQDFDLLTNIAFSVGYGEAAIVAEANPDEALREVGSACQEDTASIISTLSLSGPIYERMVAIDADALNDRSALMLSRILRDYRRSGVDKDEATRTRVEELNAELAEISTEFSKNLREIVGQVEVDSVDALEGLPQDYIDAHTPNEDGKIVITTNYPDLMPVFNYSPNEDLKKSLFIASANRAYPENVEPLRKLLEKRYELAQLLGYENYAAYITEDKMTGSPEVAIDFLDGVEAAARNAAEIEYERLLAFQQNSNPDATQVSQWHSGYLSEQIRQTDYALDAQEVRQYFAYNDVRSGIFSLVQDLFEVEIRDWTDAPIWQETVTAHEIYKDGELVGRFFLDMHPREGKFKHAAAFPIRFGPTSEGVPVASLMCNFPAGDHTTGLMEHRQVETFLHEFGHLIHAMFSGQPDYADLSMSSLEWDFIEAPSQMLENWVWDYDTLAKFAVNSDGEIIPVELVEKMNAARDFGTGLGTLRQLTYAGVSMNYYNRPPSEVDFEKIWLEQEAGLSPFETLPDLHRYASFGHLDGYSAIYYTYQWSLAIATDMFKQFEANGLRDEVTAERYRELVLSAGSSKPAAELVHDFLGRDWSPKAYEQHLIDAAASAPSVEAEKD